MENIAPPHAPHAAFTLIELSIVLVIIGVLTGTILVGNDLITAAQRRQQITQLEQYNTASISFKDKYHCLPGDCQDAAALGLGTSGNGNYALDFNNLATSLDSNEQQYSWQHLTAAHFIEGEAIPGGAVPGVNSPPIKQTGKGLGGNGRGGFWMIPYGAISAGGMLYSFNSGANAQMAWLLATTTARNVTAGVYLPEAAQALDTKIDDGYPDTGRVLAGSHQLNVSCTGSDCGIMLQGTTFDHADGCIYNDTAPIRYNLSQKAITQYALCYMIVKTGF